MDLSTLKAEHPDVYQAAVKVGVDQERDRVRAHLIGAKMSGEPSGGMKIACDAIESGAEPSHALTMEYHAVAMNAKTLQNFADDDKAVGNTADGASPKDDKEALGEEVVSRFEKRMGVSHG